MSLVRDGQETPMGTYAVTIREIGWEGRNALLITQLTVVRGGTIVDSAWIDPGTFLPARQVSYSPQRWSELFFGADRVRGRFGAGDAPPSTVDEALAEASFSGSLAQVLLRALPLAEGFSASLAFFSDPGGAGRGLVSVTGIEKLNRPDGLARSAWRTRLVVGEREATVWIDTESRRELRTEADLGGGAWLVMVPAG